jgi:toluene monooxygenase system ferredoxin subunit
MTFCKAAHRDDVWIGEMLGVVVRDRAVLLVNVEGKLCAYEDRCRHKGVPLSTGRLEGGVLTCSVHGWVYDAHTGSGINPESTKLPSYPVKIEGSDILVDVDEEATDAKRA